VKNIIDAKRGVTHKTALVGRPLEHQKPASPPAIVAAPTVQQLTADENDAGQRLDNFLIKMLKGVPKTHVYRIIRSGEVRVNKGRAQADTRVQVGDVVRVPPVRLSDKVAEKAEKPAPAKEFPILFEDDHLLAIDKPAGVAVHGGSGVSFGVIEQLRRARQYGQPGGAKFLELVHRLDRETSGILLIAKKRSALVNLQAQFKDRETGKTYLALVKGAWPANKKVLDQPLHKYLVAGGDDDGERRVKVVAKDDPDGMKAVTLVKVAKTIPARVPFSSVQPEPAQGRAKSPQTAISGDVFTLLEVTIKTGRTHQIRVHLASAGHPIVGDDKYGDFDLNRAMQKVELKRMFLHAWRLRVAHPATAAEMQIESALPTELAAVTQPKQ
jgi:23S rRNA pseudouridine955/2504/2580 synthase